MGWVGEAAFAAIEPAQAQRRDVTVRGITDVPLTATDLKRLTEQALVEAAATATEGRAVFGKILLLP